jgi:hypothetical protein
LRRSPKSMKGSQIHLAIALAHWKWHTPRVEKLSKALPFNHGSPVLQPKTKTKAPGSSHGYLPWLYSSTNLRWYWLSSARDGTSSIFLWRAEISRVFLAWKWNRNIRMKVEKDYKAILSSNTDCPAYRGDRGHNSTETKDQMVADPEICAQHSQPGI